MKSELEVIARELEARGATAEAHQLEVITAASIPPNVVEAVRLLDNLQEQASKDPELVQVAARASLLSHQIQGYYKKRR